MAKGYLKKIWLPLLCAAVVILLDQWTKQLIRDSLSLYEAVMPVAWLGEVFYLEHVPNHGAAFGIFQDAGAFFKIAAVVVSLGILVSVHFVNEQKRFLLILLGLTLGGAIGNLIDRQVQGYVTDFVKIGIPGTGYWPNFNIADSSITVSVILLMLLTWREDVQENQSERKQEEVSAEERLAPTAPD